MNQKTSDPHLHTCHCDFVVGISHFGKTNHLENESCDIFLLREHFTHQFTVKYTVNRCRLDSLENWVLYRYRVSCIVHFNVQQCTIVYNVYTVHYIMTETIIIPYSVTELLQWLHANIVYQYCEQK